MNSIRLGVYRHFKGNLYGVIGVGLDAEDDEAERVTYFSIVTGMIFHRKIEDFLAYVLDDKKERVPRFCFQRPLEARDFRLVMEGFHVVPVTQFKRLMEDLRLIREQCNEQSKRIAQAVGEMFDVERS